MDYVIEDVNMLPCFEYFCTYKYKIIISATEKTKPNCVVLDCAWLEGEE